MIFRKCFFVSKLFIMIWVRWVSSIYFSTQCKKNLISKSLIQPAYITVKWSHSIVRPWKKKTAIQFLHPQKLSVENSYYFYTIKLVNFFHPVLLWNKILGHQIGLIFTNFSTKNVDLLKKSSLKKCPIFALAMTRLCNDELQNIEF